MTYINLLKIFILSIAIVFSSIVVANIGRDVEKENKKKILKEIVTTGFEKINPNYEDWNIKHYIEVDEYLQFITPFEQGNKLANYSFRQEQIMQLLKKALAKTDVHLKLEFEGSRRLKPVLIGILGTEPEVIENRNDAIIHHYKIILTDDNNNILGETEIFVTINESKNIKQAYLRTEQELLEYLESRSSFPMPLFEKMDNLGTFSAKSTYLSGNFVWIYKNVMIVVEMSMMEGISLRIAHAFQQELENQVESEIN